MNNQFPLVTINILSYNRKDELRITLQKVFEQDYTNIEVVVVDNASTDGTSEMVEKEFPKVKLIRLKKNMGIAGWNEGFKAANGEYVLVLDDDSYPLHNSIYDGLYQFSKNENLRIVAYNIYNLLTRKSQTEEFKKRPLLFIGCGALLKSTLFVEIGYFNELYFIYFHELDYTLRCYNNYFEVLYLKETIVIHDQCMKSRGKIEQDPSTSEYSYYHSFISHSIFIIQNFNFVFSIFFLMKYIINRLIICLKYPYLKSFFKALYRLMSMFNVILLNRKAARFEVQKFYNYGNMTLVDRYYFPNFIKPKIFLFNK